MMTTLRSSWSECSISLTVLLAVFSLAGVGCHLVLGIEDIDPGGGHGERVDAAPGGGGGAEVRVRGTAVGVLGAVALELRLGDSTELLTVAEDGAFAFESSLREGDSFIVIIIDREAPCMLGGYTGTITDSDAHVELLCSGASLASVEFSGVSPAIALTPGKTEYVLDVPLSQSVTTVKGFVAIPGDLLIVDGVVLGGGVESDEIVLGLGENTVTVTVRNSLDWERVYRFHVRRAARFAEYAFAKASNADGGDSLGTSVMLSGDTLVVGARLEDGDGTGEGDNSRGNSGAVYVFRRSGTLWQQEAYLKASEAGLDDNFGVSVAISGDTIAVGASLEDSSATGVNGDELSNQLGNSGAVYVFRRTGTDWEQEAYIKASNTDSNDRFGFRVALAADTLAVAARFEDSISTGIDGDESDNSASSSGAVYVFRRLGSGWEQEAYIKASNTDAGDVFGVSLALSEDTLVVGASFEASGATGVNGEQSDNSEPGSGAVYVYRQSGGIWSLEAYLKSDATDPGDGFGHSVAIAGDRIAVGVPGEDSGFTGVNGASSDNSLTDSGAVFVFRRSGANWTQEAYIKANAHTSEDEFGSSVAISDTRLVIGARFEDSPAAGIGGNQDSDSLSDSGAVYVFERNGTDWAQAEFIKASHPEMNDNFGESVAVSESTIVVGAAFEDSGASAAEQDAIDSGAIYIFH